MHELRSLPGAADQLLTLTADLERNADAERVMAEAVRWGKRGARIAAAQARALVAQLQARVVAWDIASDVRSAALSVVQGDSSVGGWTRRVGRSQQVADQVIYCDDR